MWPFKRKPKERKPFVSKRVNGMWPPDMGLSEWCRAVNEEYEEEQRLNLEAYKNRTGIWAPQPEEPEEEVTNLATSNYLHDTTIETSKVVGQRNGGTNDCRLKMEAGMVPGTVRIMLTKPWLLMEVIDMIWLRDELDRIIKHQQGSAINKILDETDRG